LNAVIAIKIEDQDDIVLELRSIGTPPFIKEKNRRRGGIVRTMEDRLDRQLVGCGLCKQGLEKPGGRLSPENRVDDNGIVSEAGDHLIVVMQLDGLKIALNRGLYRHADLSGFTVYTRSANRRLKS
jgi:hypothetical protein